jgi:hypothetical protein
MEKRQENILDNQTVLAGIVVIGHTGQSSVTGVWAGP